MADPLADPLEKFGWATQSRLRELEEGLTWRLEQLFSGTSNPGTSGTDWNWLLSILALVLRGLGLILLGVGLYLLLRFAVRALRPLRRRPSPAKQEVIRSQLDWLEVAQSAQSRKDYQQAFQALYRALLLLLNESGLLLSDGSQTDREAIRRLDQIWSLSDRPLALRDDWVLLFETHEALCFGRRNLSLNHFLECRAAYDHLASGLSPRELQGVKGA